MHKSSILEFLFSHKYSHCSVTQESDRAHTYVVLSSGVNELPCLKVQVSVMPIHHQDVTNALYLPSQEFSKHDAVWICSNIPASFSCWQTLPHCLLDQCLDKALCLGRDTGNITQKNQMSWLTLSHGTLYNMVLTHYFLKTQVTKRMLLHL